MLVIIQQIDNKTILNPGHRNALDNLSFRTVTDSPAFNTYVASYVLNVGLSVTV